MPSPHLMDWSRLISSRRLGQETPQYEVDEYRTDFQRDYDRLIFSSPFRRLQNKTQVFPLPGSIFVHNRLTHSLEVSSVGRSLGTDAARELSHRYPELRSPLRQLGIIVSAACLAHDLGNPPFGHAGERAIAGYFADGEGLKLRPLIEQELGTEATEIYWSDLTHFDGNANAFRLLTHQYRGRRRGGYVMTYSTLASIVKYPFSSLLAGRKPKFGFFHSELDTYRAIAKSLGLLRQEDDGRYRAKYARHPLAYFVEAADDICYEIMDIEDAHKLHIITTEQTESLFLNFFSEGQREHILQAHPDVTDPNERIIYLRACVINCLEQECVQAFFAHEEEIMAGQFCGTLIGSISPERRKAFETCVKLAGEQIYRDRQVLDIELAGHHIILELLHLMTHAVLHPDTAYSQLLLRRVPQQYDVQNPLLSLRLQGVLDYISGMTDVYALDLYRKINGQSLPSV